MTSSADLPAEQPITRPNPFLLFFIGNEHLTNDPEFLTRWLRVSDDDRSNTITNCVMHAFICLLMPVFLLILPLTIIETRRELRRIKEKRLLIYEGQILEGRLVNCRGKRRMGPHEDSDYYFEVSVWYSFQNPEGVQISGEAAAERDDLQKLELPKPGTPVLVRYLNEKNYSLL